ncbi:MmcQ/YjbR family DNA-binding protein [Methylobacterium sp. NEAU 140]|uniref:MmcQ/YjbR family DNA-binding protein n=1 Tax=Methylobacterium sp. NEAU 140 TaxID=3064945 RepID=UPI00273701FD|nr:MmcQ/YjbR family DNA-binding protein [Methylobacterium sp. NEAU 140]MDP4021651.1 MmcQ/YjbR family DNA-binding protein [Methylobacterium sp. NEAU 140]
MSPDAVRALARLLPETVEGVHSGNPDFRVGGRVLATLWVEEARIVLRLTPALQEAACAAGPDLFAPLDGAWGRRGWTNLDLDDCDDETLRGALLAAWRTTAPPDLVAAYVDR